MVSPFVVDDLVINFQGICTHIWEDQPNAAFSPVWGHRIVLVNASSEVISQHPVLKNINPHVARMQLFQDQVDSIEGPLKSQFQTVDGVVQFFFHGQTVTVPNTSPEATLVKNARCLPQLNVDKSLTDLAPGLAVTEALQSSALAYFNFELGTLEGTRGLGIETQPGPAILMYRTNTDGLPVIRIEQFPGAGTIAFRPTDITLHRTGDRPPLVTILNTPLPPDTGSEFDFTLHYLAANGMPTSPVPVGPVGCPLNPFADTFSSITGQAFDTGPGCSASNLP
jgi:hypothetical protein